MSFYDDPYEDERAAAWESRMYDLGAESEAPSASELASELAEDDREYDRRKEDPPEQDIMTPEEWSDLFRISPPTDEDDIPF